MVTRIADRRQATRSPSYEEQEQRIIELEKNKAFMFALITDQQASISMLEIRDRQHIEDKADLADEITALLQKHDALTSEQEGQAPAANLVTIAQPISTQEQTTDPIAELERERRAHAQEREAHAETRARLRDVQTRRAYQELHDQQVNELKRRVRRLDHTRMGSSEKLVAMDYIDQAAARYHNLQDMSQPFHPIMEQTAARLGLSDAQLTRINKHMSTAEAWKYKVDRTFKERIGKKEIYECTVTVELDKLLSQPEEIEKPTGEKGSHQGGARVRTCKACGSDDLDRYALEYCRSCKVAHAQLLPGLRGDANIYDALDAVASGRVTIQDHVHDYAEEEGQAPTAQDEKHHAFTETPASVPQHHGQASNILQFPSQAPASQLVNTQRQEQTTPAPLIEEHAEHRPAPASSQEERPATPQEMTQEINAILAEQQQAPSNMQDKVTIEESLHHAKKAGYIPDAPVTTPQGIAHIMSVRYCPVLKRLRCSVHTSKPQANGSYFAVYDLAEVQPIAQATLI